MKKLYCALVAALILALVLLLPVFSRDIRAGSAASIRETVLRAADLLQSCTHWRLL